MVKRVLVATEKTEIPHIARVLIEENIGAMPIIDNENHPIGLLTRSDILKTIIEKIPLDIFA